MRVARSGIVKIGRQCRSVGCILPNGILKDSDLEPSGNFAIGTTTDYAGVGSTGITQYWVQNGPLNITDQYSQGSNASDANYYFQPKNSAGTAEFTPPANGTFNTQKVRDIYYGSGSWNFNSALYKNFKVHEKIGFQLRWEQYDTLNHPNWNNPNTSPTSSAFGKVTGKSGNRDQQLARF